MNTPTIAHKQNVLRFDKSEREWINRKWEIIRDAQQKADQAVNAWRKLNDEVNDYIARSGITDIVQVAKIKSENLYMLDAYGEGQWWRAHAQGHIDDLNLYLTMKRTGIIP